MFAIVAGIICVLVWLYLVLARGGFWRVGKHVLPPLPHRQSFRVAVIVPARNEAAFVSQSVASLLNQTGNNSIHIFFVDDSSTDGTAEVVRQAAEQAGKSSALTVVQGTALPSGWTGKLWAMQQGMACAREWQPQFMLFTDADILHSPDSIATLASIAESGYDLVSFMVKLQCNTPAERFLVPAFVFFFFKLYPPAWISQSNYKTAGAAGGSILMRPEALERAGGLEAIRSEIIDDCALARAVKNHGGKLWLGLTNTSMSLRPYKTMTEVGSMISRTAFNQLHHSALMLLVALVGLTITYLLPPSLVFSHRFVPAILGATAWLLMILAYLPMVRFYGLNPLWTLTLPLVAIFYMGATFHSAIRYWSGRGGQWKGRQQDR